MWDGIRSLLENIKLLPEWCTFNKKLWDLKVNEYFPLILIALQPVEPLKKLFEDTSSCKWEDNIFPYMNFLIAAMMCSWYTKETFTTGITNLEHVYFTHADHITMVPWYLALICSGSCVRYQKGWVSNNPHDLPCKPLFQPRRTFCVSLVWPLILFWHQWLILFLLCLSKFLSTVFHWKTSYIWIS